MAEFDTALDNLKTVVGSAITAAQNESAATATAQAQAALDSAHAAALNAFAATLAPAPTTSATTSDTTSGSFDAPADPSTVSNGGTASPAAPTGE